MKNNVYILKSVLLLKWYPGYPKSAALWEMNDYEYIAHESAFVFSLCQIQKKTLMQWRFYVSFTCAKKSKKKMPHADQQ